MDSTEEVMRKLYKTMETEPWVVSGILYKHSSSLKKKNKKYVLIALHVLAIT